LILIESVLTSIALFMLSFFEVPRGVLEKLNYFRSRFFWQADNHKKKYRLVKWNIICQPKDQGGLGVKNLGVQNQCLLSKWLFKLINEEGMWQTMLKRKYLKGLPIGAVGRKPGDSQFWSGLMKVKHKFLDFIRFKVNNGTNTRFWEDRWVGNFKLKDRFPSLYNLTRKKGSSVADVFRSVPLNVSFRRGLTGANLEAWFRLVSLVLVVQVNSAKDVGEWVLHQNKKFSVNSMYLALMSNGIIRHNNPLWKLKIPLKIKVFLWYLGRGVILTKDNLARRNWKGNKLCVFCSNSETIGHLFFECHYARFIWRALLTAFGLPIPRDMEHVAGNWLMGFSKHNKSLIMTGVAAMLWAVWRSRNEVVFDHDNPKTYMQVIYRGTYWCRSWALLQRHEAAKEKIVQACRHLERVVMMVFAHYGWRFSNRITL
jgi:hypothetical protein